MIDMEDQQVIVKYIIFVAGQSNLPVMSSRPMSMLFALSLRSFLTLLFQNGCCSCTIAVLTSTWGVATGPSKPSAVLPCFALSMTDREYRSSRDQLEHISMNMKRIAALNRQASAEKWKLQRVSLVLQ